MNESCALTDVLVASLAGCGATRPIAKVIEPSPFTHVAATSAAEVSATDDRTRHIVDAFNTRVKVRTIVGAGVREGVRVEPGMFLLAHVNHVPEIAMGTGLRLAAALKAPGYTEVGLIGGGWREDGSRDGKHPQTAPLIGAFGSYIVNVPVGKVARVWSGNQPRILGEGAHVIHDSQFRTNNRKMLVSLFGEADASDDDDVDDKNAVNDETAFGFVLIDEDEASSTMTDTATGTTTACSAKTSSFYRNSPTYFAHGTLHCVRVSVGCYAKVTIDNRQYLLPHRSDGGSDGSGEPFYTFETSLLQYEGEVSILTPYVAYGTLHVVRVAPGLVAKAFLRGRAVLLESQSQPHVFDDPTFSLVPNERDCFESAYQRWIHHGTIDRLWPGVGGGAEVAVVHRSSCINHRSSCCRGDTHDVSRAGIRRENDFDGDSDNSGNPDLQRHNDVNDEETFMLIDRLTVLDSPAHAVIGFLDMGLRTSVLPSPWMRDERLLENYHAPADTVKYLCMTTKDSLQVSVKLLVVFQVADPRKVLALLRIQDVDRYVERLAVSHTLQAVQNTTSQEFLQLTTSTAASPMTNPDLSAADTQNCAADCPNRIAERIHCVLAQHLTDCGLRLVRLCIEESKVLDTALAAELVTIARNGARSRTQDAATAQAYATHVENSTRASAILQIVQDQENEQVIAAARAELAAEQIRAEATLVRAAAEQKATEMVGEQYRQYPALLQLELTRLQMGALTACMAQAERDEVIAVYRKKREKEDAEERARQQWSALSSACYMEQQQQHQPQEPSYYQPRDDDDCERQRMLDEAIAANSTRHEHEEERRRQSMLDEAIAINCMSKPRGQEDQKLASRPPRGEDRQRPARCNFDDNPPPPPSTRVITFSPRYGKR